MKISIIGAGNVGAMTAMHLCNMGFENIVLVDTKPGRALGCASDLSDARFIFRRNYHIEGSQDFRQIKNSGMIIITAGIARQPGMSRQDLLTTNSRIIKDISTQIKQFASAAIVIVVTNPLDPLTYLVLRITGFSASRVFGMGPSLDSSRFANQISEELSLDVNKIEPYVIGGHGKDMLPLARFTKTEDQSLNEVLSQEKVSPLIEGTIQRGAQIVSLYGSGSAYFAPSAAIAQIVKIIAEDKKEIIGLSAYLNRKYGVADVCIGVPCRLGRDGIIEIIELELNEEEKSAFLKSARSIKDQINQLYKEDVIKETGSH